MHTAGGDDRVDEYHQEDFQELISNLSGYKYFLFKGKLLYEIKVQVFIATVEFLNFCVYKYNY